MSDENGDGALEKYIRVLQKFDKPLVEILENAEPQELKSRLIAAQWNLRENATCEANDTAYQAAKERATTLGEQYKDARKFQGAIIAVCLAHLEAAGVDLAITGEA